MPQKETPTLRRGGPTRLRPQLPGLSLFRSPDAAQLAGQVWTVEVEIIRSQKYDVKDGDCERW